jgi:hypothetical protein
MSASLQRVAWQHVRLGGRVIERLAPQRQGA